MNQLSQSPELIRTGTGGHCAMAPAPGRNRHLEPDANLWFTVYTANQTGKITRPGP